MESRDELLELVLKSYEQLLQDNSCCCDSC
jgi:cell division septum initiation protein DivIVA